jgi:hypothetical protein
MHGLGTSSRRLAGVRELKLFTLLVSIMFDPRPSRNSLRFPTLDALDLASTKSCEGPLVLGSSHPSRADWTLEV